MEQEQEAETSVGGTSSDSRGGPVPLEEWLEDKMAERDALIRQLRHVERLLLKHGRLRHPVLPVQEQRTRVVR